MITEETKARLRAIGTKVQEFTSAYPLQIALGMIVVFAFFLGRCTA